MQHEVEKERSSVEPILAEANALHVQKYGGPIQNQKSFRCVIHEDRHPSANIYQTETGAWKYKCLSANCGFQGDVFDLRAKARGIDTTELFREMKQQSMPTQQVPAKPRTPATKKSKTFKTVEECVENFKRWSKVDRVEAFYHYTNVPVETLQIRYYEVGCPQKKFSVFSKQDGAWIGKFPPQPFPLYNLGVARYAKKILMVEGEKCVDAVHGICQDWTETTGVAAVSPLGGADSEGKKAHNTDWSPLAGKDVYWWPDNDVGGKAFFTEASKIVAKLDPPCRQHWINPENLCLAEKEDVADFILQHQDCTDEEMTLLISDVLTVASDPLNYGASKEVLSLFSRMAAGEYYSVQMPWGILSRLTKALLPEMGMVICAPPGSGKTFFVLQLLAHLRQHKVPCSVLMMEQKRKFHLIRSLAQFLGTETVLDDGWFRDNPRWMDHIGEDAVAYMDMIGRAICTAAEDGVKTLEDVAKWVERRAQAGDRVIIVDPVTKAKATNNRWTGDEDFVDRVKTIAEQFECSVVMMTHNVKDSKIGVSMDAVAGGAAYSRFFQTVLWIEKLPEMEEYDLRPSPSLVTKDYINRKVHIVKANNGKSSGAAIGFLWDEKRLVFDEMGICIPRKVTKKSRLQ